MFSVRCVVGGYFTVDFPLWWHDAHKAGACSQKLHGRIQPAPVETASTAAVGDAPNAHGRNFT